MSVWKLEKWRKFYDLKTNRIGLRLRIDNGVNPEVRRACKEFCQWIRKQYIFPMRVPVYIKSNRYIKAMDGELVSATFFWPESKYVEPYIRVATGDYDDLLKKCGNQDDALATILCSITHELTHYFQWINDVKLNETGEERQARLCANRIVDNYAKTREHA